MWANKKNVTSKKVEYGDLFKETDKEKQTIEHFLKLKNKELAMEALSPGGEQVRTCASLTSLGYAADVIL